jgi:uncharacterized membrane protein YvbJ
MVECAQCGKDFGDASYDFCTECGSRLENLSEQKTLEIDRPVSELERALNSARKVRGDQAWRRAERRFSRLRKRLGGGA